MGDGAASTILANDFSRQWQDLGADALAAVDRVGRSGWLVLGDEVRAFERELAEWWGVPHAVGVGSGLDALEIGLRCAGVAPGDRVLTTPMTAFATTLAVLRAGGEPVWCDVDDSGGMAVETAREALRADPSISAVLPVHLYGHPLDLAGLREVVAEGGAALVEDCAQSAGAELDGRPTGSAGAVAATSFYPTKNLGALGDGGALLTADAELAERARRLRDYGQRARYEHVEQGLNSRLDELQAAVLRTAMLPRLDRFVARRGEIADHYATALRGTQLRPIEPARGRSAHHLFPVEVLDGDPDAIASSLRNAGVAIGRHYPFVCPDQAAVAGIGVSLGQLPIARRIASREFSLPLHPYLEDAEVERVIDACRKHCA